MNIELFAQLTIDKANEVYYLFRYYVTLLLVNVLHTTRLTLSYCVLVSCEKI